MILVVGATGQLGTAIIKRLVERGDKVRAFVRKTSNYEPLETLGVELAFGDLCDPTTLAAACQNIDTIIATANAALPSQKSDSLQAVDGRGYENLLEASKRAGVRHFIYTSAVSDPGFDKLPIGQMKRLTEERLRNSGIDYTIFRADAFMDVSFAMMGSEIPIRGTDSATVRRPFWFTSRFFNDVKDTIETKGSVGILGDGDTRHSYVCIDDLAQFHVAAVGNASAKNRTFDIGGPEALTQKEVAKIFERVLGRSLKTKSTPLIAIKLASIIMKAFSPAAANIMGINYSSATNESNIPMTETAGLFDVKLTTAENFLKERAGRPATPATPPADKLSSE